MKDEVEVNRWGGSKVVFGVWKAEDNPERYGIRYVKTQGGK